MEELERPIFRRGDIVACGSRAGFIAADVNAHDAVLRIRWNGEGGTPEAIDREGERGRDGVLILDSRETIHRNLSCDEIVPGTTKTALELLEALEAIERVQERTRAVQAGITTQQGQRHMDSLIQRSFAVPKECVFDEKFKDQLLLLALRSPVSVWFRIRELLHRPIHDMFHRPTSK